MAIRGRGWKCARKRIRCRRERVLDVIERGNLPYEQRGKAKYVRLSDVEGWEKIMVGDAESHEILMDNDLAHLA